MKRILFLAFCLIVVRLQSQQWVVSYPVEEGVVLVGGDCNGCGNFIVGACNRQGDLGYKDAYAMYVDNNGDYVDRTISFEGYKAYLCNAVCRDDGNAFVVGVKGGTTMNHLYDTLWISIMNPNLEIVEEHNYPLAEPYITWTTDVYPEFDSYGDIIVLTSVSEYNYPSMTNGVYAVFKCDTNGNLIDSQYFTEGHGLNGARPSGLIRVPDSDNMMMLGKGFNVSNSHSICYIDNNLNKIGAYPLPLYENIRNHTACWKDNGHFLMSSMTHHHGMAGNNLYTAVFEVDATGHYVDTLVYDRADTSDYIAQFGSMVYVDDADIYIATYWDSGNDEMPSDAVICLIDNDLNLKGTKQLKIDNTKIRLMHCQKTSEGSCLVYGQCKKSYGSEMVCVWNLSPEDFVIPWTLDEKPEVLQHQNAYPNPTRNILNISMNDVEGECRVSVFDLLGRKYFERRFERGGAMLTLDVSKLEAGTYFYEVTVDGRSTQKGRFMKN